jgi:hypothetical protein
LCFPQQPGDRFADFASFHTLALSDRSSGIDSAFWANMPRFELHPECLNSNHGMHAEAMAARPDEMAREIVQRELMQGGDYRS